MIKYSNSLHTRLLILSIITGIVSCQGIKNHDPVWAARAEAMLLPEETSRINFWLTFKDSCQDNPQVMQELGRAYLYQGDIINATGCFRQAMEMDPGKKMLLLNLAQYHMEEVRQDSGKADSNLRQIGPQVFKQHAADDIIYPAWRIVRRIQELFRTL